ncbi:PHD finger protein ALFIN-LIKE 6-like [Daphnia magna]|nr:PHD finger protein ALFIN-LIKE 6-like [Daphnia magna]
MGTSKNSRDKNVAPAAVSRRSSKTPAVKPKTSAKPAASISALPAMPAKQKRSLKKRTEEEYDMGFCDISLCSKPNQDWIGCDNCNRWFHFRCAKIKKSDYKKEDPYVCPLCKY